MERKRGQNEKQEMDNLYGIHADMDILYPVAIAGSGGKKGKKHFDKKVCEYNDDSERGNRFPEGADHTKEGEE
ncbi:MAG: hypothetical protein IJ801_08865 [Lachnospiraceae bacterium]|nr:hypothetical protein [Lachnospiraceae bacterium]